jgi:hypothetical protein
MDWSGTMAEEETTDIAINDGDLGAQLPTVYSNRFYIIGGLGASRLAFGELLPGQPETRWRAAFLVPNAELLQLADLIKQIIGPIQGQGEKQDGKSA